MVSQTPLAAICRLAVDVARNTTAPPSCYGVYFRSPASVLYETHVTRVFSTRSTLTLCPLFLCSVTSPSIASASAIGTTGSNRDVVVEHFRTFHDGDALQDVDAIVGRMPCEDPVHQEQVYIRPPLPPDSSYHFTPRRTRLTSAYADMASAPNSRFDSQGHYLVVGRQGPVYPRLSIEELQLKQPKQFTLFIIAYLIIQGREVEESAMKSLGLLSFEVPEAASFLALAGVHGLPYEVRIWRRSAAVLSLTTFPIAEVAWRPGQYASRCQRSCLQ